MTFEIIEANGELAHNKLNFSPFTVLTISQIRVYTLSEPLQQTTFEIKFATIISTLFNYLTIIYRDFLCFVLDDFKICHVKHY